MKHECCIDSCIVWAIRPSNFIFSGRANESRLLNILQFQTLIASKAVRCVLAACSKPLIDFGMRRAHDTEGFGYA